MSEFVFPKSYEEWRHCITVKGGITLTPDYVTERIASLKNENDPGTRRFVKLYGQEYCNRVLGWFMQESSKTKNN